MEFNILPLFKSHYSLGRSILTLSDPDDSNGPDSIFSILKESDMKMFYLIDDSMSGFLEAYTHAKEEGIQLVFGLRLSVCENIEEKTPESLKKECKYIIFVKNTQGYKRLIKIYSDASQDGFYYQPRIDFNTLKKYWSEKDLMLVVPFYDSFLFKNSLQNCLCVPDFSFSEPKFFIENNDIPFDPLMKKRVTEYASDNSYEALNSQSIFYKNKQDFKSYLTFRCINNRTTLNKPNLEHMCSDQFSFESWKEKNG